MDLTQVMNTDMVFSIATMDDILARYSVKAKGSTSTTNKTPATVKTTMSTLRQAYARVHGTKPDGDFGDLTWLTVANLRKPGKYPAARPLFEGAAHPDATETMRVPLEAASVRKNLENFRSALYAANKHLATVDMADSDLEKLNKRYDQAYQAFGELSVKLLGSEQIRLATREPSQRQQSKWVSWPVLKQLRGAVVQSLESTFREAPDTMSVTEHKKLQRSMQFLMSTLIPPMRNDFAGLRFIGPQEEDIETLRASNSPNYILVKDDNTMEIVINRYKTDGRSQSMEYNPDDSDFAINTEATKRFPLVANATLTKFGFDPVRLSSLLLNCYTLQQGLLGGQNPHNLLFFELKRDGQVQTMTSEGMSTRMSRITQRLTATPGEPDSGQTLGTTMFRTIFLSWFNERKPTQAQRQTIAEHMMHSVQTQLNTYSKTVRKRRARTLEGGGKRPRVTAKNMRI